MEPAVLSIQGDSPREGGLSAHRRLPRRLTAGALVLVLLALAGYVLYARGGGPVPAQLAFLSPAESTLLAASSPAEATLRALRLAGIERAVVGESGDAAVARIEVPSVSSAADIEIAWQTAAAALSQNYPHAEQYVVQLFGPDAQPLLEVTIPGRATRSSVSENDSAALLRSATFRYLSGFGVGR